MDTILNVYTIMTTMTDEQGKLVLPTSDMIIIIISMILWISSFVGLYILYRPTKKVFKKIEEEKMFKKFSQY